MTTWFAPGRIEVLGKHTDYAGGESLLAVLDAGVTVAVTDPPAGAHGAGAGIVARSDAMPDAVRLDGSEHVGHVDHVDPLPPGHWGRYLRTVVARLERNFGPLPPCRLEVSSTLPLASGMSSSSALLVAAALALAHHHDLVADPRWVAALSAPEALATYLACIENGASFGELTGDAGVGTFGGSQDHTAMVCCRPGELARFTFVGSLPALLELVPVPADLAFVVVMSGVLAEKTGAALERYNRSAGLAREVVRRWNAATGRADDSIGAALAASPAARERMEDLVGDDAELSRRLRQFVVESQVLIPAATRALHRGDLAAFGAACAESMRHAEDGLGNQIAQTRYLARRARELGAYAASAFGAGYGGSVWALADAGGATAYADRWLADYRATFPDQAAAASVLVTRPAGGVRAVG